MKRLFFSCTLVLFDDRFFFSNHPVLHHLALNQHVVFSRNLLLFFNDHLVLSNHFDQTIHLVLNQNVVFRRDLVFRSNLLLRDRHRHGTEPMLRS